MAIKQLAQGFFIPLAKTVPQNIIGQGKQSLVLAVKISDLPYYKTSIFPTYVIVRMAEPSIIKAEELLLDERFQAWAQGEQGQPGFAWVEGIRMRSEEQELEVLEAYTLFQQLVRPEMMPDQQSVQRTKLLMRLDRDQELPTVARSNSRYSRLLFAGFFLILIGLAFWLIPDERDTRQLAGDGKETFLEDGTRVQLTSNSTLTFQKGFAKKTTREVWVKGEAAFHVKHTPEETPFLVHTPAFDIEVTGTRFIVNNDTKIISVLLQEGSVNLRFPNGEVTQMKPGDYFSLDESKVPVSEELVRAESLDRHIVFDNTPITQVIREIESRYSVRVELVSSELKNKQITGILPNDNLQILLQALSVAMDCSITQEKQTIFIKSAIN